MAEERLLNLAVGQLPEECRYVAWIDCDVVFDSEDWPDRTVNALDHCNLVQLFDRVDHMPAGWRPSRSREDTPIVRRTGIASIVASGVPPAVALQELLPGNIAKFSKGFAWAARRELLETDGFYDECIVGGGDAALVAAAFGCCFDFVLQREMMHDLQKSRYLEWGRLFHNTVGSKVGALDGTIRHFWHGELKLRRPLERYAGLIANSFDPAADLATTAEGPWRWNTPKPALHEYVASYFLERAEDG